MLKETLMHRNYEEEAFLFAKCANICSEEIFNNTVKFPDSFFSDCQDQYLSLVVIRYSIQSVILYGSNLQNDVQHSQPCFTSFS